METGIKRKHKQPCFWCLSRREKIKVSKLGNNNKEVGFLIEEIETEGLTGKKTHLSYAGDKLSGVKNSGRR